MERETRRFSVRSDDGRKFEIIEYASIRREFDMHTGSTEVENRLRRLVTSDGQSVNPTESEDQYLIVPLNLLVRVD